MGCAIFCAFPSICEATYSIVALDASGRFVGGAAASCVGDLDVSVVYGLAPGEGAIHAQARLNTFNRDKGRALLAMGATPSEVIETLVSDGFDVQFTERQYGVVAFGHAAATYTGADAQPWAGGRVGRRDDLRYAVQGNILTSEAVVLQAEAAFLGDGCDLPERLIHALVAGQEGGEGDRRCTVHGVPADSAFLRVDGPNGRVVELSVSGTQDNAVLALEREYQQWRTLHPCPAPMPEVAEEAPMDDTAPEAERPVSAALPPPPAPTSSADGGCRLVARRRSGMPLRHRLIVVGTLGFAWVRRRQRG